MSENTREKIITAAEKLVLLGNKNPTNQDIRDICRASFSHISPVMREWRNLKNREAANPPVPDSIERMGKTTIDIVWDAAIKAASDCFVKDRAEYLDTINQLTTERDEAFREADRLESINDEIIGMIESIKLKSEGDTAKSVNVLLIQLQQEPKLDNFGDRLASAMRLSGVTQSRLAEHLDIAQQSIQFACSAKAKGSKYTEQMAQFLGVTPGWLAFGDRSVESGNACQTWLADIDSIITRYKNQTNL